SQRVASRDPLAEEAPVELEDEPEAAAVSPAPARQVPEVLRGAREVKDAGRNRRVIGPSSASGRRAMRPGPVTGDTDGSRWLTGLRNDDPSTAPRSSWSVARRRSGPLLVNVCCARARPDHVPNAKNQRAS